MDSKSLKRHFVNAMAKHLPPSSSNLRLVDVNGEASQILSQRRADLDTISVQEDAVASWTIDADSVDAVVAYDVSLDTELLKRVLDMMRAGGRFITILPNESVSGEYVDLLESHGYIRILVEPAVDDLGVLIRGEKTHSTDDTFARIQQVAAHDANSLDLATFKGRYLHLLVRQSPNKPVWKLTPDEPIEWQAVAIQNDSEIILLAFSSLPKAVGFMQPAVVENVIQDINKVGKFSKQTASNWSWAVMLNPTLDMIRGSKLIMIDIDPNSAEASDE